MPETLKDEDEQCALKPQYDFVPDKALQCKYQLHSL